MRCVRRSEVRGSWRRHGELGAAELCPTCTIDRAPLRVTTGRDSLAPKLAPTIEENQAMAAKRQRLVRDDAKFEKALEELRALS